MNEEETQQWSDLKLSIEDEGFEYCFDGYNNWEQIKDNDFQTKGLAYLAPHRR